MDDETLAQQYLKQSEKGCVFCTPCQDLIIHENQDFFLLFDPFALTPGHLLIQSREHYGCFGEVPRRMEANYLEMRAYAVSLLENAFDKPVTSYEHGRAGHCMMSGINTRSCHHHHEHLLPAALDLHKQLEGTYESINFHEWKEVSGLFERYDEYLLVAQANGDKRFYIASGHEVEPHLLRTLAANALGAAERHDWEAYRSCILLQEGRLRLAEWIEKKKIA